jgi:hypothetical protein
MHAYSIKLIGVVHYYTQVQGCQIQISKTSSSSPKNQELTRRSLLENQEKNQKIFIVIRKLFRRLPSKKAEISVYITVDFSCCQVSDGQFSSKCYLIKNKDSLFLFEFRQITFRCCARC